MQECELLGTLLCFLYLVRRLMHPIPDSAMMRARSLAMSRITVCPIVTDCCDILEGINGWYLGSNDKWRNC